MLRVLGEPPLTSSLAFATPRFREIQKLFYGALGSDKFVGVASATRRAWAGKFGVLIKKVAQVTPVAPFNHRPGFDKAIPVELIEEFDNQPLDKAQVLELQPYLLVSKSGIEYNVLLAPLAPILGDSFASAFHEGLQEIARPKAKDSALRDFGTTFARFVQYEFQRGNALSSEQLLDAEFVQTMVVDFMEFHFMKMVRRETPVQEATLSSLQRLWGRYRGYWSQLAEKGIVAAPSSAFPEGNPKLSGDRHSVAHRRVITEEDGTSTAITQKLIVPVPLHLTDDEATQLLFQQLRGDFATVQRWLKNHLDSLFSDYQHGNALACGISSLPSASELSRLFLDAGGEQETIALAVKYFKIEHSGYIDTSKHMTVPYPDLAARRGPPKTLVSRYLGLPLRRDALALMGYLASHDGRFSESAMAACVLLDQNATRINAVETDGGLVLSVLKERNAKDGWHNITLKGDAAQYVRQWIETTQPLRTYMRKNGITGWQNLFIYVSKPLGAPAYFTRSTNLYNSFRAFASAGQDTLGDLANNITIPRIRSTRGVLVFLETMDLAAMARELGNTSDTSLRHYLPDVLWSYFTTRWLRIFQNLMIVEATRDTQYMQRALKFESVAEMDAFLRNHAVEPLLPKEVKEENLSTTSGPTELMVPASLGLFTTLLSVTTAVDDATSMGRKVAPQAIYWSEFTKKLKTHIESNDFHDRGIKKMMVEASKGIDPSNFAEVVCG
jgi:hypothetical protein